MPYLTRATERDRNFALGFATLAEAELTLMTFTQTPQQDMLTAAQHNTERAITLDPELPEAQAARAYVLQTEWDWQGAATHFKKALVLKPEYAAAKRRYAGLLLQFGNITEALPLAEQAFSEDPYDRGAIPGMGLYYFLAGQYEKSVQFLEPLIGENDMQGARHNLGDSLAEIAVRQPAGERARYFERALVQAARVMAIEKRSAGLDGVTPMGDEMYAHYLTMMGDLANAEPHFVRLRANLSMGAASPAIVAWIYAIRGEKDRALDLLEQAFVARDRRMFYVKLFPALANLRGEARFRSIVARMNL